MRIRSLKPEFWADEVTGIMAAVPALLFAGLWNWSDDQGRFRWDPVLIRAALDPYDAKFGGTEGVAKLLDGLEHLGIVKKYEADGRAYGFIPSAPEHFKVNRPTQSKLPPPPRELTRRSRRAHGGLREDDGSGQGSLIAGEGDGEGDGVGGEMEGGERGSPQSAAVIPVDASPFVRWLAETYPDIDDPVAFERAQRDANPAVDILSEAKRARAWEIANPRNRKHQHGRFLSGWFARTQDKARTRPNDDVPPRRMLT